MEDELDFSIERTVRGSELLSGTGRLGRLAWLGRKIKDDDLYHLQDGAFSQLLFNEVIESYVNGQFVAAIILGFSFIERAIAGRLHHVNAKIADRGRSNELISAAFERGWLTTTERDALTKLGALRNSIIHFREHLSEDRPEVRSLLGAMTLPQMMEADAKLIVETAILSVLNATAL